MLLKKLVLAPDPRGAACKNCRWYHPQFSVCAAKDSLITKEDAETWRCGDWERKEETTA